jgi:hypothetical protein
MNQATRMCVIMLCILFGREVFSQTSGLLRLVVEPKSQLANPDDLVEIYGTDSLGLAYRFQVRLRSMNEADLAYDDSYPLFWKDLVFEVGDYSLRFDSVQAIVDTGSVWVLGVSDEPMESIQNTFPEFYQKFMADGQCYYFLKMTPGRRRIEPITYGQAILLPDSCRPPRR